MKIKSPVIIALTAILSSIALFFNNQKSDLFFPEIIDYPHKTQRNALFEAADRAKYAQDYQKANTEFERLLKQSLTPVDRHYVLNQLAYINLTMNEDSAAGSWIQLLENEKPPLSMEALADYYYNVGTFAYRTFKPKMSDVYLQKALAAYKVLYGEQHLKVALCMTQLGMMHYEFNRADTALKYIPLAYTIFQKNEELKPFSAICELGMAYVNIVNRSHIEGESRCDKALLMLKNQPFSDTVLTARLYCIKGYLLKKQGQNEQDSMRKIQYFKTAETNFTKAVELGKQKETIRLQEFYSELIINYSWLKDSVAFFKNIEEVEKLLKTSADRNIQIERYVQPDRLKGYYYFENNNDKDSKEAYLKVVKKVSKDSLRDTKVLVEAYYSLTHNYKRLSRFDSSLFYLKEYYIVGSALEGTTIQHFDLLKPKVYKHLIFPFVTFSQMGDILLQKYYKTHDFETLLRAFEAFTLTDDMLFPGIMTADEEAILNYQKEVANKAYPLALETTYLLYHKTKNSIYLDYAFRFCERSKAFLLYRDAVIIDSTQLGKQPPRALLDSIRLLGSEIHKMERERSLGLGSVDNQVFISHREQYNKLFDSVKIHYPIYAQLKIGQPVPSIKEVLAVLGKNKGVIQYHLGKNKIHTLFISATGTVFTQSNALSQVAKNLKIYKSILSGDTFVTVQEYQKTALWLYDSLVAPCASRIQSLKELIIIPDKNLHLVPFESFVTQATADTKSFLDLKYFIKTQISYTPAWKIYQHNYKTSVPPHPNILALNYGDQPNVKGNLPQSMKELAALQTSMHTSPITVLMKERCTRDNFLTMAPSFDILHLSLHAESNMSYKEDNKIYFKIPLNDALYSYDIAKMNLKAALVVLSACNTATGKMESSEGAYSLTRSFLQAGVSNVVASLWNISDSQTAVLLTSFYENLAQNKTPSVSLHLAKQKYLKGKADNITGHPKYWAGVICID
jgi:CHAT domain-containing protein